MVQEVEVVLAPVDGSDESRRAAEYAVTVAAEYDATVHAVYVLDEETVRAVETDRIDETEVTEESDAFLDRIGALADDADVPLRTSTAYGFSTRSMRRHPGSVVLDAADQEDADFLVLPHESVRDPHGRAGGVLERAAEYVLLYASQPVLSV
ncbi:MAG: universal stress protein [Haloferacaceae archaeon]